MKFKRLIAGLLSLVLCLCVSIPSYASSISTITNTINYSGALIKLYYYTPQGNRRYVSAKVASDGSFAFPRPSDLDMPENLVVSLSKSSLPSAGNYSFIADFALHTPMTYSRSYTWMLKNYNNVASQDAGTRDFSLVQNLGDFQISGVIELGYIDVIEFGASISGSVPSEIAGVIKVQFKKSTSAPQVVSPGADTADQDIQSNISNNTSQMVEKQEETNGLIAQIIQTISNQLTAFWNQLAGEFTNLYNKMNQQHQEKIEADRNNTEDIIDELGDNTTTLINNNNENTEKIANGYDNSGMNSDNEKLGNSMKEQADQEQEIMDQISKPLNDFEFDNPVNQYLSSFQLMGNFMQSLFVGSGGLKDAINLSFLMCIALMVAGLYRFKGGN